MAAGKTGRIRLMLAREVRRFLEAQGIGPQRVVVAVSGGVDSTALLLAFAELRAGGFEVVAAHVNHHLRGAESDGDEAFIRMLCKERSIPFQVANGALDPLVVRDRGIEAAAREIRYLRLTAIRENSGAGFVATAHQKDDQAETVLIRILTGSGLAGFRGIHPIRDDGFIRPLLDVTRAEIDAWLAAAGVVARRDRSNYDPRFLRNRVRSLVREAGATDLLAAIGSQARSLWPHVVRVIDDAEKEFLEVRERETSFAGWPDDLWLRGALLQRQIRRLDPAARDFNARRLAETVETITRATVTKRLELMRLGGRLVLRPIPPPRLKTPPFEVPLREGHPAHIEELGITVHLEKVTPIPQSSILHPASSIPVGHPQSTFIQLPAEDQGDLIVRNRRRGDRFQPLGLAQAKKLKDLLIDRRIEAHLRDSLPLVVWKSEIVWVVGVEVSERFKVTGPEGFLYRLWTEGSGASANDANDRDQSDLHR